MKLKSIFTNKKVLITGHTGFKGTWLSIWLHFLGAKVIGVSNDIPSDPSHFLKANLNDKVKDYRVDIRDLNRIKRIFSEEQPEFVFHLAAQPLVRLSYSDPVLTYSSNVMGTLNILESLRALKNQCIAVMITSDKCYDNVEWVWGYKETDALGGSDPYSASKGAAELVIKSYIKSYFKENSPVKIGIGRAGNVIGGGDWASDRIVPDCVRAFSQKEVVSLRNPKATRPWQHVLEPLSGYLNLALELNRNPKLHGEPFNFGPPSDNSHTVMDLVLEMQKHWSLVKFEDISVSHNGPYESGLLKLNCDKALYHLKWKAILDFKSTIQMTSEWYKFYYESSGSIFDYSLQQILEYTDLAKEKELNWAL